MTLILNDLITAKKKAVQYLDNATDGKEPKEGILLQISGLLEDSYGGMTSLQMLLPAYDQNNLYIEFENPFSISEPYYKKQLFDTLQDLAPIWMTSPKDDDEPEEFLMTIENILDKSNYYKSYNKHWKPNEEYDILIYGGVNDWYNFYVGIHFSKVRRRSTECDEENFNDSSDSDTKEMSELETDTANKESESIDSFMDPSWRCSVQIWTDIEYKGHPRHDTISFIEHSIYKLCEIHETCCQYTEPRLNYIYQLDDLVKKYVNLQDIRRIVMLYHNLHYSSDSPLE